MSGEGRGFVIDTNVIVGAFFYNSDYPQLEHSKGVLSKCRLVLYLAEGKKVLLPKVAIVEAISVVKRISGDETLAKRLGNALENSFETVPEGAFYELAKEVASQVAPSGFDTYFLTLAVENGYSLITRDKALCNHAREVGVDCLMIDEGTDEEMIKAFMEV